MHVFRVWAPRARGVELALADGRRPMEREERGWWSLRVEEARSGTRYAFALDGGEPRPDPRSRSQPDGPHAPSELVDPRAFAWKDASWRGLALPGAVLYELHVGTYTPAGTFDALIERLPHLVALGVDALELMPVAEAPGTRGWGYDGVALFAPSSAYGGPAGLQRLVDACHAAGLGVVLDVVYNHLGPAGNYLPEFGPYFCESEQTAWGPALNLDGPGSEEVRRFVLDNALQWLRDYHVDGLRLDAVHALVDRSALHVLEELVDEVRALACHLRRPLFVIAESDANDPRLVRAREAGGYGLDAVWADDWHHALHALLTGESDGYYADYGSLATLAKALQQAWVHDGTRSDFRDGRRGRSPAGLDGARFVVCTQNHDQVGNRAAGERLAALTSLARLKVAAALLLTAPFTPLLFQGEEWAAGTPFQYFTDHEPDLGRAVREGRRAEFALFGWRPEDVPDPQDERTFARSRLDWSELGRAPHAELLAWYRELLALRRRLPCLSDPRLERHHVRWDEGRRWIAVKRGEVLVAACLGPEEVRVKVAGGARVLARSHEASGLRDGMLVLRPDSVVVLAEEGA